MPSKAIIAAVLPMLALALSSCGNSYRPEPALPVRPAVSHCPAYPLPPGELLRRPAITDFLPPQTKPVSSAPSSPPSRLSSSAR